MPSSKNKSRRKSNGNNLVPFFVLNLGEEGKTKALFTVPTHLAETLIQHPVLCRGAAFDLRLDDQGQQQQGQRDEEEDEEVSGRSRRRPSGSPNRRGSRPAGSPSSTCFICTEYISPHPEATASAISERLATRVTNSGENPLSTIFGF